MFGEKFKGKVSKKGLRFEQRPGEMLEKSQEQIWEIKQEIFETKEISEAELSKNIEDIENLLIKEKEKNKGRLKSTITEIVDAEYENGKNEYFVDGQVAYLPKEGEAVFVGDLHGDADALESIVEQVNFIENIEQKKQKQYLVFLGDYAGRGKKDIATINAIMKLKLKYPDNVVLLRGNHEGGGFRYYGLYESIEKKCDSKEKTEELFQQYNRMVREMPGIVVTGNGIVGTHGGIPDEEIKSLKDLTSANVAGQMCWNYPRETIKERMNIKQVAGTFFGKKPFERFMLAIKGTMMIRSHEAVLKGFELKFDNRLVTIFSNGSEKSPSSYYRYQVRNPCFAKISLGNPKQKFDPQDFSEVLYEKIKKSSQIEIE